MRKLYAALLLIALAATSEKGHTASLPQPDEPAFPRQQQCHVALPNHMDWKPQEHWAWNKICLGKIAAMSDFTSAGEDIGPIGCNPAEFNNWPKHRVISNEFLQVILRHPRYQRLIRDSGVQIWCAKFEDNVDLSSAIIKSPLSIDDSVFEYGVNLIYLKTSSYLSFQGSKFHNIFNADGLDVSGDLALGGGATFRDVDLVRAKIGGVLHLAGSKFSGLVDLTESIIKGELFLATSVSSPPEWLANSAAFTLRNVHAGSLQDTPQVWNLNAGKIDLNGFTYERLGGLKSDNDETLADRDLQWLLNTWFGKQKDHDVVFQPQPYRQLAKILRNTGREAKADAVLISMRDHERTHSATPIFQKMLLTVNWALLGYGYRVWLATIWFSGLVLLGTFVVRIDPAGLRVGFWHRFFYSLESAVPLIELTPLNERFANQLTPRVDRYFNVHKIAGLIIVSVLVAGMTGIVR